MIFMAVVGDHPQAERALCKTNGNGDSELLSRE